MAVSFARAKFIFFVVGISQIFLGSLVSAQQKPAAEDPEVLRITSELVQTGVVVLDKQGRFVEGLKPEQFLLRVDGKPVTPTLVDHVVAGTPGEQKFAPPAARDSAAATTATSPGPTSYQGRTIIFFVDDLHLSLDSLNRTRKAILEFVEHQMSSDDRAAVASASGQIGFLQQLTDNKAVLRAAVGRLYPIPYTVRDTEQPPMPEFIAIRIVNGDRDAAGIYVDKIIEGFASRRTTVNRNAVYEMVKNRANQIVLGLDAVTKNSLGSLENLLRTSQEIVGRKLVFYASDGFYLNSKNSDGATAQLRRVIDIATRSRSVVYTIDARGLFASAADATGDRPFDPQGRLDRAAVGEGVLSQDGLNALAADTGGRFLKNQNYFERWVGRMLDETSNYYLLAWRPEADEQKPGNFKRIDVSIVGRPDLTVRLPRGFLVDDPKSNAKASEAKTSAGDKTIPIKTSAKGPDAALIAALGAPAARKGLPTTLSVTFVDVPNTGPVLTAATQMATDVLGYGVDGKQPAAIDVAGVVLNDKGKPAGSFKTRVNVNPSTQSGILDPSVIYSHKLPLKPGIYQVRVAAVDDQSGRVGSAAQWIEIPDLTSKRLALSSLLVGGQFMGSNQKVGGEQVQFTVDHHFAKGAHLNFLTIIYNAATGSGTPLPELDAQIQISRNGQSVVSSPVRRVAIEANADLARIVYGGNVALQTLPPGRYLLQVTISDRIAKANATQQVNFEIQ